MLEKFRKNIHLRQLTKQLATAQTYDQWHRIANLLDDTDEIVAWRYEDNSPYFDYQLIDYRLKRLKKYRHQSKTQDLLFILQEGMSHDIGYINHPLLFTVAQTGTKNLVEHYLDEVCASLIYLKECKDLTPIQKKEFFERCYKTYGQPALMFSGGATLGLFHSGVCKALLEQQLLPRVLSGASAGAVMASLIATKDPQSIENLLNQDTLLRDVFQFKSLKSMIKEGFDGFTDIDALKAFLIKNLEHLTFEEAYQISKLELNIAVAPYNATQLPKILNRYTAPHVLVWSAVLASCAVPMLFPAVELIAKQQDGTHIPFMANTRWVDGSMRSDLPQEKMVRLYNINYTIASQANPHVVPFMQEDEDRFRHDLLSWPERIARRQSKIFAKGVMDFTRERMDVLPPVRRLLDHGYGIMNQQYYGDINIIGKYSLRHYSYLLKNPEPDLFKKLQKEGERATWARMAMIKSHARVGNLLQRLISDV